ncbi:c-type cytochrome [Verminephrobacter aporrectodeae]|nr:cytochrome c [Verminephrobacter aporrectodeae]
MSYRSMRRALAAIAPFLSVAAIAPDAASQEAPPFSSGKEFIAQTGQQLYQTSCQGCHMADGKGARGAGTYPALANNGNLQVAEFIAIVVMHGKNGMPGFREYMSDAQLADVMNHVRSSFGNNYDTGITADFVKKLSSHK